MGNTDKNEPKKFRRKIKIRLADPSIPDSYICEIFDSSLENEDDEFSRNDNILQKGKDDPPKPKNYFDLLMSKNCKKNDVIKTTKGNNGRISHDDDDDDNDDVDDDDEEEEEEEDSSDDHDEAFQKRRQKITTRSRNSLANSVNRKIKEIKCEFGSPENKSFLQSKGMKSERMVVNQENDEIDLTGEDEIQSENLVNIFDPPKIDLTRKKTLSILNYFSKREMTPNNSLKCHELEETSVVELKTSQSRNNLQHSVKNDSKKQCKNGAAQVVLNGINKENLKLAPLFCKKRNNSNLDSVRQKARLEFLYKASPSAIKKSENKTTESIFHFPMVTHVQQRNQSLCWSLRQVYLPLQKVSHSECVFNEKKKFSLQIKQSTTANKPVSEDRINFSKELLCKIKYKYLDLNLDAVIDGLKDNRDRFLAQMKAIEKSKINSFSASNDGLGYEELNTLWTEKYKPKSGEILGNANAVRKLKRWLQSWKSFNNELKVLASCSKRSKRKQGSSDDDEDDFLDLANENLGLKVPGNVCIISGPNGCGKSALVCALANELEFNVLELNASSKRTGKKVLTDLQEATQSHKVHRMNPSHHFAVQEEKKKKKVKKPRKGKKSLPVTKTDQTNDWKMSLILVEDAEIVFDDHDEGFYSAIASLVQTSKRPLIFLTNESNFMHLENLKTADQCLKLEMEPPNFYKSCAVLDVVSSLEGVHFEKEILESLLRHNGFDLRRSLLELQFWIGSGGNLKNLERMFDLGCLWWGLSKFLFDQDRMHVAKCKGRKRKRVKDLFDSSDDEVESAAKKFKSDPGDSKDSFSCKADTAVDSSIESYFRILDIASTLDGFCLTSSREPLPGNECRPKDSLSLCENMEEVLWGRRLAEELSDEMMSLSTKIFSERSKEKESVDRKLNFVSPCWEEVRWRSSHAKASEELSGLVSLQKRGDKRSLYLDYLPALRNICRVERHRSEINPKRKNRFYHYLNNLGPELSEENLEINCEVFSR